MAQYDAGGPERFRNSRQDHDELHVAAYTRDGIISPRGDYPSLFMPDAYDAGPLQSESVAYGFLRGEVLKSGFTYNSILDTQELPAHPDYPRAVGHAFRVRRDFALGPELRLFGVHAIEDRVQTLNARIKSERNGYNEAMLRTLGIEARFLHYVGNLIQFDSLLAPNEADSSPEQ